MSAPVHELFWASVRHYPERTALVGAGESVSYEVLGERVGRLAGALAAELPVGSRVGLMLPKTPEVVTCMLACLTAGLVYVPIDRSSPVARRRAIAAGSGLSALVGDPGSRDELSGAGDAPLEPLRLELTIDDVRRLASEGSPPAARHVARPADLAYVLHTSGSTGVPKGVLITHANAALFVGWAIRHLRLAPDDRLAVHAPLHFDLPTLDVFGGLGAGGAVCLMDERTVLFPAAVRRFLVEQRITVMYAVPSAYVALLDRGGLQPGELGLRLLVYAGEPFHVPTLRRLVEMVPGAAVFNLYGPVETNVVTARRVTAADLERPHIPLGAELDGVRILLRGDDGRAVSGAGEEGELCVVGACVSPGYLVDGEIVPKRIAVRAGDDVIEAYPTGDFATHGPEGELRLLGRRDGMVKTRGFRVETGDVEAALLRHEAISEAAVYPVDDERHSKVLHAVVVPRPGAELSGGDVVAWCRRELPHYAVPVRVAVTGSLRYTSTGKVDRRALRELTADIQVA